MCLHKHANMGCKGQRLADVMWWMSFQDTRQVVEVYKSGFDPPGDVEFEDYSATMRRSISESSYLDNRTEERRQSRKLWPFIRKTKVYVRTHTHKVQMRHTWRIHLAVLRSFSLLSVADPPVLPPPASTPTPNLSFTRGHGQQSPVPTHSHPRTNHTAAEWPHDLWLQNQEAVSAQPQERGTRCTAYCTTWNTMLYLKYYNTYWSPAAVRFTPQTKVIFMSLWWLIQQHAL